MQPRLRPSFVSFRPARVSSSLWARLAPESRFAVKRSICLSNGWRGGVEGRGEGAGIPKHGADATTIVHKEQRAFSSPLFSLLMYAARCLIHAVELNHRGKTRVLQERSAVLYRDHIKMMME